MRLDGRGILGRAVIVYLRRKFLVGAPAPLS